MVKEYCTIYDGTQQVGSDEGPLEELTVSDVTNLNFQGYPCDISHRHFYRFGGFFFRLAVKIVNGGKKIVM